MVTNPIEYERDPVTGAPIFRKIHYSPIQAVPIALYTPQFYITTPPAPTPAPLPAPTPAPPAPVHQTYTYQYPTAPQPTVYYHSPAPPAAPLPPTQNYGGYTWTTPSPAAAPQGLPAVDPVWRTAFHSYYPEVIPYNNGLGYHTDASPYQGTVMLPSPRSSPYISNNLFPEDINPFAWIDSVPEPERSWTTRMADWFMGRNTQIGQHEEFYQEISVHRCLDKRGDLVQWNISHPPYTVYISSAPDPHCSAFDPPLSSARVICALFPWVIDVKARHGYPFITVMSLLGDIYQALRHGIGREAYESFSPRFREQVKEAYYRRCYSIPDEAAWEYALRKGVKRVDFTLNKKMFGGIVQVRNMMMTFEIKLLPV
ncbi:hypothetical protein SISSUDRAFT_1050989 [Sistotremastrum suecicum HHB10207 ss-3]|uniref:DUF6699 domain-containing protein n=1 Tax=Sistotremastrum suecicum HHB10207 ss-3 TaxID=1314776 RepID=A0A166AVG2_9AGAM|nr:hypothetical protein SISSUDRAFT_1050989 [Sistotremastrum suecicum HHB10207 ss-3]